MRLDPQYPQPITHSHVNVAFGQPTCSCSFKPIDSTAGGSLSSCIPHNLSPAVLFPSPYTCLRASRIYRLLSQNLTGVFQRLCIDGLKPIAERGQQADAVVVNFAPMRGQENNRMIDIKQL